jgi:hypothetical protein
MLAVESIGLLARFSAVQDDELKSPPHSWVKLATVSPSMDTPPRGELHFRKAAALVVPSSDFEVLFLKFFSVWRAQARD